MQAAIRVDREDAGAGDLDAALACAFAQVASNLPLFAQAFPHDTSEQGIYRPRHEPGFPSGANVGWTTGFWTGMLWTAYELTGRDVYRQAAAGQLESYADRLVRRIDIDHHDLGFLYTPSCVAAWRVCADEHARASALRAADVLMQRYLPKAGIIQAWGDLNDPAERGRLIIDCLLNLPLLHWASEQAQRADYRAAARSHARLSAEYLVRADASTFHTYHFDPHTGAPLRGSTAQGAADASCWARGQAWGLYGFALNHRFAPDLGLLDVAIRLADYFLAHLPTDGLAYWDLSLGDGSAEPRDSSANAIAICGLLEICTQLPHDAQRERFETAAFDLLRGLNRQCAARQPSSNALLLHGVYSKPHGNGIDEANLWGDYFYLEALARVTRGWRCHWY